MPSGGRPYPRAQADTVLDERKPKKGKRAPVDTVRLKKDMASDRKRARYGFEDAYRTGKSRPNTGMNMERAAKEELEKSFRRGDTLRAARRGEVPVDDAAVIRSAAADRREPAKRKPVKMKRGRTNSLAAARDRAGRDAFRAERGR